MLHHVDVRDDGTTGDDNWDVGHGDVVVVSGHHAVLHGVVGERGHAGGGDGRDDLLGRGYDGDLLVVGHRRPRAWFTE